jgi:hypothetical protein
MENHSLSLDQFFGIECASSANLLLFDATQARCLIREEVSSARPDGSGRLQLSKNPSEVPLIKPFSVAPCLQR